MAKSYLLLKPTQLPLSASALDASSVVPIGREEAAAGLRRILPSLAWDGPDWAKGECEHGWVEFLYSGEDEDQALSLRCSLRADYTPLVQRLCDECGWVAFDETPLLFQPGRLPEPL